MRADARKRLTVIKFVPLAEAICRENHAYEWMRLGSFGGTHPHPRPSGPCIDCQTAAHIAAERGAK